MARLEEYEMRDVEPTNEEIFFSWINSMSEEEWESLGEMIESDLIYDCCY